MMYSVPLMSVVLFLSAGSSASGHSQRNQNGDRKLGGPSGSDTETGSLRLNHQQPGVVDLPPSYLPPPPTDLASANPDLNTSRQSFKMAMGNPC